MPEGDTLYNTALTLRKALLDEAITRCDSPLEWIRAAMEADPLAGKVVTSVETQAKHLLIRFSRATGELSPADPVLHTHLRMTGSWHIYRPGERWRKPAAYAKIVLHTSRLVVPCFSAPVVQLSTARAVERHPTLQALGPDAITEEFDLAAALERLRAHPQVEIGVALLDQKLFSGVGNVFKSEVLFLRRVHPRLTVGQLAPDGLRGLVEEAERLLKLNRGEGERRTHFSLNPRARLWAYGRSGEPCRICGTAIRLIRQGLDARSTYYCPACQAGDGSGECR